MRKTLALLAVLLPLTGFADSQTISKNHNKSAQRQDPQNTERSGCCSHHQGVCGCSGYRAQCCDGTLSPSCGCAKDDADNTFSLNDCEETQK